MHDINHQESDVPRPASTWGCGADGRAAARGDRVAEETITRAVMVTVMLSIFAHGCSALPGMALYTRKVATLAATSPENRP
jgi:hypothetical protein